METVETSGAVLGVRELTKRYRSADEVVEAVSHVNLTLRRGEFVAVMGASGSGKSTLLHLIAGLTEADEGSVTVAGSDIFAMSDRARTEFRRREIGLVFQAYNLIPSLTARENIALPILLGASADGKQRVEDLVTSLGLERVGHRRPDAMSGGEQQRVAIGRALVTHPALILADEPTGNLDSANGQKLCRMLKGLCTDEGRTVLMVTHNPVLAFNAERVLVLHDGRVVHECSTKAYESVETFACDCIERTQAPQEASA